MREGEDTFNSINFSSQDFIPKPTQTIEGSLFCLYMCSDAISTWNICGCW